MIGVIGGTGLSSLSAGAQASNHPDKTPFGNTSSSISSVSFGGQKETLFLVRHGDDHSIAPHEVNYRANIWALKKRGVERIIATYAVGGIDPELSVGDIVVPDQLVDYTWGREHTFVDHIGLQHIDFTSPFDANVRQLIIDVVENSGLSMKIGGVYGVTQGPRLETAAEIKRMEKDGCTVVGMTAMPEAALARELDIHYAGLCFVVNPAPGLDGRVSIDKAELELSVEEGAKNLVEIISRIINHSR